MWSLLRLTVWSLLVILIAGCSDPEIDTSSMPASVVSIEKVRDSLPAYKRSEFDQGLIIIATASAIGGIEFVNPHRMNAAEIAESANMQMHGLTGDQIIQRADQILRERRASEREQAISTLKRLDEKRANAVRDQQQLARFSIDDAQFYISQSPYGAPEPVIDLTVTNGTDQVISELLLRGVVTSPEQPAPWVDEAFYYVFQDGIKPGETLTWSLAPNRFGPWGNTAIPATAELTVTLNGLRDENQQPLWDSPELTEHESAKLMRLQDVYGGVAVSNAE